MTLVVIMVLGTLAPILAGYGISRHGSHFDPTWYRRTA